MNLTFHRPYLSERGVLGQADRAAQSGDQIWLISGCECPMVLRPVGDNYEVVGEAYLPGANFWEPLAGEKHNVSEGEILGRFTACRITLV